MTYDDDDQHTDTYTYTLRVTHTHTHYLSRLGLLCALAWRRACPTSLPDGSTSNILIMRRENTPRQDGGLLPVEPDLCVCVVCVCACDLCACVRLECARATCVCVTYVCVTSAYVTCVYVTQTSSLRKTTRHEVGAEGKNLYTRRRPWQSG